jgi:sortase A
MTAAFVNMRRWLPENWKASSAHAHAAAEPLPHSVVTSLWISLTISLLAGWFALYAVVLSGLQQHHDNAVLYKQLREALAEAVVPIAQPIDAGTPIALLKLPAAGLSDAVVVEGTGPRQLATGVGHLRSTPLPGQPGVSVLYGRSLTYGAPFGSIGNLKTGATFSVTTGQGTFHYRVDGVRRAGDPLPQPLPAGGSRLMFETSTGSAIAPSKGLFLDATLQGASVPAASAPASSTTKSETAFGTDHSSLAQLIFWLQGLLTVVLLAVWASLKWGRRQAWLLGLPAVVALLWGLSGNVMLLLPNLI